MTSDAVYILSARDKLPRCQHADELAISDQRYLMTQAEAEKLVNQC